MKKKVTKKLTDNERAINYYEEIGRTWIDRYPYTSVIEAYKAGLRAGRRERRK
jgi:hypothetical protein